MSGPLGGGDFFDSHCRDSSDFSVFPLTPIVAIWVQLQSIPCQTGLSRSASEYPDVKNYKWPA